MLLKSLRVLTIPSVLALALLAGCTSISRSLTPPEVVVVAQYPPIPNDLRNCFDEVTGFPNTQNLTNREIVRLIVDLRQSETRKTQCGRRLIDW